MRKVSLPSGHAPTAGRPTIGIVIATERLPTPPAMLMIMFTRTDAAMLYAMHMMGYVTMSYLRGHATQYGNIQTTMRELHSI